MSGSLDLLLTRNPIQSFSMMRQIYKGIVRTETLDRIIANLGINGALKAVYLADQNLHIHEPLDWADNGGDNPHGLVGGDGDTVYVT